MNRQIKPPLLITVFLLSVLFLFTSPGLAQDEFRLNVHRNFGFSSGSQIRGTFTAEVLGTESSITSVTFQIDGSPMTNGVVNKPPFNIKFNTQDYPLGWHDMTALIQTSNGRTITTQARRFEYVSSQVESETITHITIPLFGIVFLIIVVGLGIQFLAVRNRPKVSLPLGAPRKYGISGGGICPHCHRPFPLHWWAFNVGLNKKYDRCDYCGKWSSIKPLSRDELAKAEAAELQMARPEKPISGLSAEEKLKQQLDESRFTDKT